MKKTIIILVAAAIGAFLWWTISPLFINVEVQDELDPEIAALLDNEDPTITTGDTFTLTANKSEKSTPPEVTPESVSSETNLPVSDTASESAIRGPFVIVDTPGHPATGNVRVIDTPEQTLVRYENYDGTNGPDLKVYLTNDLDAADFISLGAAKGNQGNINYTVPSDVDVSNYKYVVTWCEAFGVLFDYAEIN